jgi:WD40 repeat protein
MFRPLIALIFVTALSAQGQPQLRLELGFHLGAIKSLSTDAAEKFLVTASDDKTVRVWDIASGRQLNVLRPPIGDADEGKMYAAAITPDGATIAAGGWTGPETHSIYIFDRASARIRHVISGLKGVTLRLSYSPDGRYLVAASGEDGIRLYRTPDYFLAGEDKLYKGNANWAVFSPAFAKDGLLATAGEDLYVRVYRVLPTGRLQLLRKRISQRKEEPNCLAFSPDASQLAVSFAYDAYAVVEVWNPNTLARVFALGADTTTGQAATVAWSADGKYLYAAGDFGFAHSKIARWDKAGRGDPQEVETGDEQTESSIGELLPLRNGSLLFATGRPALGMLDSEWKQARFQSAPTPR